MSAPPGVALVDLREWPRVDLATIGTTEPALKITLGAATDTGGRPDNEDAVLVGDLPAVATGEDAAPAGVLMAVADGMGGHLKGEVASHLAIDTLQAMVGNAVGPDTALMLKQAFRKANDAIYASAQAEGGGETMGTTLVVAATRGKYATIANVGDSRAYLVRANRLTQITQDHTLVAEQVAQGAMSRAQAKDSPHRHIITHALGHRPKLDPKMPNIFELTMLPEDRLVLCSDGFNDVVAEEDFVRVLLAEEPDSAVRHLIDLAKQRGTSDNVSAVAAKFTPAKVAPERPLATAGPARGVGGLLVPLLVSLAVIVFIAAVLLILTLA